MGTFRSRHEDAHAPKLVVALLQQQGYRYGLQLTQVTQQKAFECVGHFAMIAMGATERFGNDIVYHAQAYQIAGGELESLGSKGFGIVIGLAPQDAGASFRADDGIISELQHGDAIADAYTQGPPPIPLRR